MSDPTLVDTMILEPRGIKPAGKSKKQASQSIGKECKCPQPPIGVKRRNLVVCIDGTANQFGQNNSNVVELYSRLEKDAEQLTYYDSGIGTYVKEKKGWKYLLSLSSLAQSFNQNWDKAIAWSLKKKVLDAYEWLSENYQDGDRIYLFGFSRGAYQARVIAGMIEVVGLLHKGNKNQIPFAYDLYKKSKSSRRTTTALQAQMETTNDPRNLCTHFKSTLSRPQVRVHFVGAWDTVSSIGFLRGRSLPETTTGMRHVCAFRHALALDERRVKFLPEYVNGGFGPSGDEHTADQDLPRVKEVWFAGCHADVGGGNVRNLETNQFSPALRWMAYEAICWDLRMRSHHGGWKMPETHSSMTVGWKLFEYLPISHLSYRNENDVKSWSLHRAEPCSVQKHQRIHQSVQELLKTSNNGNPYKSAALTAAGIPISDDNLEKDLYSEADKLFELLARSLKQNSGMIELKADSIDVLETLSSSISGLRSITEVNEADDTLLELFFRVATPDQNKQQSHRVFDALIQALQAFEDSETVLGRLFNMSRTENAATSDDFRRGKLLDAVRNHRSAAIKCARTVGRPRQGLSWKSYGSFHALLIGIDTYLSNEIRPLRGCIRDTEDLASYLRNALQFNDKPNTADIRTLLDKDATCEVITETLRQLKDDVSIQHGDPILIYFAGYGTLVSMSQDGSLREPSLRQVKRRPALLAFDADLSAKHPDCLKQGVLPLDTLATLLNDLANAKGKNITVILDCGYTDSTANHGRLTRSIRMKDDAETSAAGPSKYGSLLASSNNLHSGHVLIAACGFHQSAEDVYSFTQVLLNTLVDTSVDQSSYVNLIERMGDLSSSQSPFCEGRCIYSRLFRILGNRKDAATYDVAMRDGTPLLSEGSLSDIIPGTRVIVYNAKFSKREGLQRIGIFSVDRINLTTSTLTRALALAPSSEEAELEQNATFASLESDSAVSLSLHITDETLRPELRPLIKPTQSDRDPWPKMLPKWELEGTTGSAHLTITRAPGKMLIFKYPLSLLGLQVEQLSESKPVLLSQVREILLGAARFFKYIRFAPTNNLGHRPAEVEIFEATSDYKESKLPYKWTDGRTTSPITIKASSPGRRVTYSLRLTRPTTSRQNLFVWCFYLSASTFSIDIKYEPQVHPTPVPWDVSQSELTIDLGGYYVIGEKPTRDTASFIRIVFATKFHGRLSTIAQSSRLEESQWTAAPNDDAGLERNQLAFLDERDDEGGDFWDVITIPVIERVEKSKQRDRQLRQ